MTEPQVGQRFFYIGEFRPLQWAVVEYDGRNWKDQPGMRSDGHEWYGFTIVHSWDQDWKEGHQYGDVLEWHVPVEPA